MIEYPWFDEVGDDAGIEQGDIIVDCNAILAYEEHYDNIMNDIENDLPLDIITFNGIVLSQSCDIINDKITNVIVCPVITLKELCENDDYYKASAARESLRQGKEPAHHLLHRVSLCQDKSSEFYVVSFRHVYSIPKRYVKALIKNKVRKRLLPPYREHLSQSFARYFMRVGLPTNISKDEIKNYDRIEF